MHPLRHPRNAALLGVIFIVIAFIFWVVPTATGLKLKVTFEEAYFVFGFGESTQVTAGAAGQYDDNSPLGIGRDLASGRQTRFGLLGVDHRFVVKHQRAIER